MRRLFSVIFILLCGMTLWGCANNNRVEIAARHAYFIQEIIPFALGTDTDPNTGEEENPFTIGSDSLSHLMFDTDFKSMWIDFVDTTQPGRLVFVVTSGSPNRGNISGTASRILRNPGGPDHGKLIRYSFWSDKDTIYLSSLVAYNVRTEHEGKQDIVPVERNAVVAWFSRAPLGGDA